MLRSSLCFKPFIAHRGYSTVTKALNLSFDKHSVKPSEESPLLICHGLFGSKQNWSSLAKALSTRLNRDVYTLDLRNHGDSPHSEEHTYEVMASDLANFVSQHNLKNPILLGHSMGGKAVMATALQQPDLASKLVVVDMPPLALTLSRSFASYVDAMREIEASKPSKQSDADKILAKYESNIGVRMFLLTNLKRTQDNSLRFRVPYDILGRSLSSIGAFDIPGHLSYDKPTLFIAGGNSSYRPPFDEHSEKIANMFPKSQLEVVEGAGHWVHAEKPDAVLNLITTFINK